MDQVNHGGVIGEAGQDGRAAVILAADKLTGEKVVNEQGETLGTITHIMLNIREGSIAYAVLSFGGFLGLGDKLFAVPWHSLALDTDDKWFVLNIEKEKLKSAPGFDKDNWPSMADTSWRTEVHAYYGPIAASRRPFI